MADALQQPFSDGSFDLIWSLESGEHMPDKQRFVGELARVCAPGGRIIIVTWCHRLFLLLPLTYDLLLQVCFASCVLQYASIRTIPCLVLWRPVAGFPVTDNILPVHVDKHCWDC